MASDRTYISFGWALKKLLRQKANFGILEGFLSELLKEDVKIQSIADSESNKDEADLEINRVDILVEDTKGRLMAVELQYNREIDYFYRMLFMTCKSSIEHLKEGYDYSKIKKVYSINLLYFELGKGQDYVYHGRNEFKGIHLGDTLQLSEAQREEFLHTEVYEIYPEYYVIKINAFDDVAKDSLDEWIYFFKHSKVPKQYSAKGLKEVEEKMRIEQLSPAEKKAYEKHQLNLISERNVIKTARKEGLEEGEAIGIQLTLQIIRLYNGGKSIQAIANETSKSVEFVKRVLKDSGLLNEE
ncbi:MAG: PD-(D/E)XK nuclease family transposase [Bacteroidota bacterium]